MLSLKRHITFIALLSLAVLFGPIALTAQTVQKQATGVITGRVTSGDKGMANVPVVLYPSEISSNRAAIARGTTDGEGNYRLTGVPAGRFSLSVAAPEMVGPSDTPFGELGKPVTVAEGETIDKMDFSLVRGGVITGRVTDADGNPVIDQRIQLHRLDSPGAGMASYTNPFMYQTDDRGVYRIYGIPSGRYTVSAGDAGGDGSVRFGFGGEGYYTRTFYPDVTDESRATAVDVSEGSEATHIDITLGRKAKSFTVTGRIVDDSGQAVANMRIGYGAIMQENRMGAFGWGSSSDAKGNFRLDGLLPGRYAAFAWNDGTSDGYSDAVQFQIADGDISGLELKLHHGSSISGVAVIEGTNDRNVLAQVSQLTLYASTRAQQGDISAPNLSRVKIAPDGSFTINGLRPGKFSFHLSGFPQPQGFTLARVEQNGVQQQEIEVAPGAQVTDVRIVIQYGNGSIRGLVKVVGDVWPDGIHMSASARPLSSDGTRMPFRAVPVDSRGHFLIEGLPAGDYEVILSAYAGTITPGKPPEHRFAPVREKVSVSNGVEAEVTLTFDPNAKLPEVIRDE
ncbi:MAG TPA: carboxypeptidase-like regulatory domain-containing protein [Pyrinomonadaceae bacterium]|nr:carboxypeptidase-like regulatory domain-containing protein [Pyrinomonadaceae bacterium]